jgi:hypothetical protein
MEDIISPSGRFKKVFQVDEYCGSLLTVSVRNLKNAKDIETDLKWLHEARIGCLELSSCNLAKNFLDLSRLDSLLVLNLYFISGLTKDSSLWVSLPVSLVVLRIWGVEELTDIYALERLVNLKVLSLRKTGIKQDSLFWYSIPTGIEVLDLFWCEDFKVLPDLRKLMSLRVLNIMSTGVAEIFIEKYSEKVLEHGAVKLLSDAACKDNETPEHVQTLLKALNECRLIARTS